MSCHAVLSMQLDEYTALVQALFDSLDPAHAQSSAAATAASAGSHSAAAAATPVIAASSGAGPSALFAVSPSDVCMRKLLRKDALLQESVAKLLTHQRMQRRLQSQYAELAALDACIISFCSRLASLEGKLLAASQDDSKLGAMPTSLAGPVASNPLNLSSLLQLSEKLGRMSMPPSDHLEKKTSINENVCRPPAPLEKYMAHSLLRLDVPELARLVEAEAKAREDKAREEAEAAKLAAAAAPLEAQQHMVDISAATTDGTAAAAPHLAGSLAALGRQDSSQPPAPSGLPSFAELSAASSSAAAAAGAGASGAPPSSAAAAAPLASPAQMWRQESAHRNAAPVALDLDLESSDEDEEDD